MRKYIDIISETFNTPVVFRWTELGPVNWVAKFEIADMVYEVILFRAGRQPEVELSFGAYKRSEGPMRSTQSATGTGNAFSVYSTVLNVVDDFMDEYGTCVDRLVIESDRTERNRHAVNKRLAGIIADRWNFEVEDHPGEGKLVLDRLPDMDADDEDEDEDEEAYA